MSDVSPESITKSLFAEMDTLNRDGEGVKETNKMTENKKVDLEKEAQEISQETKGKKTVIGVLMEQKEREEVMKRLEQEKALARQGAVPPFLRSDSERSSRRPSLQRMDSERSNRSERSSRKPSFQRMDSERSNRSERSSRKPSIQRVDSDRERSMQKPSLQRSDSDRSSHQSSRQRAPNESSGLHSSSQINKRASLAPECSDGEQSSSKRSSSENSSNTEVTVVTEKDLVAATKKEDKADKGCREALGVKNDSHESLTMQIRKRIQDLEMLKVENDYLMNTFVQDRQNDNGNAIIKAQAESLKEIDAILSSTLFNCRSALSTSSTSAVDSHKLSSLQSPIQRRSKSTKAPSVPEDNMSAMKTAQELQQQALREASVTENEVRSVLGGVEVSIRNRKLFGSLQDQDERSQLHADAHRLNHTDPGMKTRSHRRGNKNKLALFLKRKEKEMRDGGFTLRDRRHQSSVDPRADVNAFPAVQHGPMVLGTKLEEESHFLAQSGEEDKYETLSSSSKLPLGENSAVLPISLALSDKAWPGRHSARGSRLEGGKRRSPKINSHVLSLQRKLKRNQIRTDPTIIDLEQASTFKSKDPSSSFMSSSVLSSNRRVKKKLLGKDSRKYGHNIFALPFIKPKSKTLEEASHNPSEHIISKKKAKKKSLFEETWNHFLRDLQASREEAGGEESLEKTIAGSFTMHEVKKAFCFVANCRDEACAGVLVEEKAFCAACVRVEQAWQAKQADEDPRALLTSLRDLLEFSSMSPRQWFLSCERHLQKSNGGKLTTDDFIHGINVTCSRLGLSKLDSRDCSRVVHFLEPRGDLLTCEDLQRGFDKCALPPEYKQVFSECGPVMLYLLQTSKALNKHSRDLFQWLISGDTSAMRLSQFIAGIERLGALVKPGDWLAEFGSLSERRLSAMQKSHREDSSGSIVKKYLTLEEQKAVNNYRYFLRQQRSRASSLAPQDETQLEMTGHELMESMHEASAEMSKIAEELSWAKSGLSGSNARVRSVSLPERHGNPQFSPTPPSNKKLPDSHSVANLRGRHLKLAASCNNDE